MVSDSNLETIPTPKSENEPLIGLMYRWSTQNNGSFFNSWFRKVSRCCTICLNHYHDLSMTVPIPPWFGCYSGESTPSTYCRNFLVRSLPIWRHNLHQSWREKLHRDRRNHVSLSQPINSSDSHHSTTKWAWQTQQRSRLWPNKT